nr:trypsin-like peptidase domain-containing protein [Candidatus Palauibacterales bacterium]
MSRLGWRTWILLFLIAAFPAGLLLGSRIGEPARGSDGLADGPGGSPAPTAASIVKTAAPGASDLRPTSAVRPPPNRQGASDSRRYTPIVEAANLVAPSVVSIGILSITESGPRSLFEDFFGRTAPRSRLRQSYGSGFVIDDQGFLVTNEHVVRGADSIVVTDAQGRVHAATVVGADELTDIAVLRVD